jgi:hypothetical protein
MRIYQFEMKRTSYVNMTIEAETVEEAEALAWERVTQDYYRDDGNWEVESIEVDEPPFNVLEEQQHEARPV